MGKLSRDKGARFERWVVNWLRSWGHDARRNYQHRGEADGPDVTVEMPMVECLYPGEPTYIAIECKHHKRVNLRAALRQVKQHEDESTYVAVCAKDDNEEPVWVVPCRTMEMLLR